MPESVEMKAVAREPCALQPRWVPLTSPRAENDTISKWPLESERPGFEPRLYHFLAVQASCLVPLNQICSPVKRVLPHYLVRA